MCVPDPISCPLMYIINVNEAGCLTGDITYIERMAGSLCTVARLKPLSQSQDCCGGIESVQFASGSQRP